MSGASNNALYFGRVRHARNDSVAHEFEYDVCFVLLDLDELDTVFAGRWFWSTSRPALAWFRRADYHGDAAVPLKQAVLDTVEKRLGRRPNGRVRMLTTPRMFFLSFNPVTFYYCYDAAGALDAIAAEITNTPWLERHTYVLDAAAAATRGTLALQFHFAKTFHVSPFIAMDCEYDWKFTVPEDRASIHMENARGGRVFFAATMALSRREMSAVSLARTLLVHPWLTAKVVLAIYWQALRLRLKGATFYSHPTLSDQKAVGDVKEAPSRTPRT